MSHAAAPYVAVVSARYRMLLQYRAAALAGFATQLFWGAIKLMVLGAFYAMRPEGQPLTWEEIVVYVWLGQALLATLPWNVDPELAQEIRSGNVAYELVRPVDLYGYWFARTAAFRVASASMRSVLVFVFAMGLLPLVGYHEWALPLPRDLSAGFLFTLSLGGAVAMAVALTMLLHISLITSLSGQGVNYVLPGIVMVLCGLIVPLPLFPDWMQPFLVAQPFRGLADVPYRIYSGDIGGAQALRDIAQQLVWAGVFVVAGRAWLSRAMRRVVIQGG
jgi:ABC-2 type transport system permease protein